MKGIGGNLVGVIQIRQISRNSIGEQIPNWADAVSIKGWLDLLSGDSNYLNYYAKIQESTHVFVADYIELPSDLSPENSRMIINGKRYDVTMIDNPMEMGSGSQLEIFLKYAGGQ